MICGWAVIALAAALAGGVAPAVGRVVARSASRSAAPGGAAWRAHVAVGEAVNGAVCALVVMALYRLHSPGGEWLMGGLAVALVLGSVWHQLDDVDGPTTLARAIGRARDDDWLLNAARHGEAVRWAIRLGGAARVIGGGAAVFAWAVVLVSA